MKAIETQYKGYRFRSRIEARWAVFFDTLGIEWEYEKEGYILNNGIMYLPDFWIEKWNCFAEIKPMPFSKIEFEKCRLLYKPCLLLDTSTPLIYHGYSVVNTGVSPTGLYHYRHQSNYGKVLLEPSKGKGRLWFMFGEDPEDYWMDISPEKAARSARFEHGEKPNARYATI